MNRVIIVHQLKNRGTQTAILSRVDNSRWSLSINCTISRSTLQGRVMFNNDQVHHIINQARLNNDSVTIA